MVSGPPMPVVNVPLTTILMMNPTDRLPPLTRLLLGYAPKGERRRQSLLWALDRRLADVVRTTREPMIGRIRLTWWHDALTGADGGQGMAEPLVAALAPLALAPDDVEALIMGWEALLDPELSDESLADYARGRGRLFIMLSGCDGAPEREAGAGWALWDLSGHVADRAVAERAVAMAADCLVDRPHSNLAMKPLRMLASLAHRDVIRGKAAPAAMTVGQYLRVLGLALRG